MPSDALIYRGFRCDICGREFDDLDAFDGHAAPDGDPCPGGVGR